MDKKRDGLVLNYRLIPPPVTGNNILDHPNKIDLYGYQRTPTELGV